MDLKDKDIDQTMNKWEFNAQVAQVFDEMLERSIPQYQVMRDTVADLGKSLVVKGTDVVDLGSSRGEAVAPLISHLGATCTYLLVEVSQPMLTALRERYAGLIKAGIVRVIDRDMRQGLPPFKASLVQAVLTLMFTPINYRQSIVQEIYDGLIPKGAFIVVEKVLGEGAAIDGIMVEKYHKMKERNGYTQEEIARKALALEGVQVPVTARWNEEILRNAGFKHVDCFWRWLNFAGWLAIK